MATHSSLYSQQDRTLHPGRSFQTSLEYGMSSEIHNCLWVWALLLTHCLWLYIFSPHFPLYKMEWFDNRTSEVSSSCDMLEFSARNLEFLVNSVRGDGLI